MSLELRIQQLEQGFRQMTQQIRSLSDEIMSLKQCCCSNKLYFITIDGIFWFEDQLQDRLNLDDRLPIDDVCEGAKAIAVTEDATLYILYTSQSGWIVTHSTYGGKLICCGCGDSE